MPHVVFDQVVCWPNSSNKPCAMSVTSGNRLTHAEGQPVSTPRTVLPIAISIECRWSTGSDHIAGDKEGQNEETGQ